MRTQSLSRQKITRIDAVQMTLIMKRNLPQERPNTHYHAGAWERVESRNPENPGSDNLRPLRRAINRASEVRQLTAVFRP
jgi:hypothetical protein